MNTLNWRIRQDENSYNKFFFIEADLPPLEAKGHFQRVEVMQEDFGDHNGYTHDLRMADAMLIVKAPKMEKAIIQAISLLNSSNDVDICKVIDLLSQSIENIEPEKLNIGGNNSRTDLLNNIEP